MARFEPISADIVPQMKVPTIAPTLFMAPIHESSSFDIGPLLRGVSLDNNTGNAGDNHLENDEKSHTKYSFLTK